MVLATRIGLEKWNFHTGLPHFTYSKCKQRKCTRYTFWKSPGAKTPQSMTGQPEPCLSNIRRTALTCTKWLPSDRSSDEASRWSQIPKRCGRARSCLTVVPFTKPRILCWRHTFTDNTLWQMYKSRPLFCLLVTNVILNKKLLNKQILTTHSYFPIDLRIIMMTYKPLRNNNYETRRFPFV